MKESNNFSASLPDAKLIERYIAQLRWLKRSAETIKVRESYLRKLSLELGPFRGIKAPELQLWLGDEDRNLAPSTQALYLTTFNGAYQFWIKAKLVKRNPCKKIDKPASKHGEPHPISDEDLTRAFTLADSQAACWLALGAFAGLRAREIALIVREDIHDDDDMTIFVANGKGSKTRWVPLAPELLEKLNAWGMPATGRLWDLNPQQMSRAVNDFLHHEVKTASTCHALRHAYATKLYQATHDIRLVQILLGHSSVATTQIYAAPDMSEAAPAVAAISFKPKAAA